MNNSLEHGRLWGILVSIQKSILMICSILATLLVVANVFLRYVLKINFLGFEEIMCIVIMWMYFIGASYGSYEKSHISADMLSEKLKNRNAKILHSIIITTIDTMVLFFFCYLSIEYGIWNLNHMMHSASLKIPLISSQGAIIIGFLLMLSYNIYYLIMEIKNAILVLFKKLED